MTSLNDDFGEHQSIHRQSVPPALDPTLQSPSKSTQMSFEHTTSKISSCATKKKIKQSLTPSRLPFFIVIGSLFLGTFLVALDATIIGTAIPAITTEYRSLNDIGWYGSGYLLTLTALQPTFGTLFAMWNTKTIYIVCVLVFEGKAP